MPSDIETPAREILETIEALAKKARDFDSTKSFTEDGRADIALKYGEAAHHLAEALKVVVTVTSTTGVVSR